MDFKTKFLDQRGIVYSEGTLEIYTFLDLLDYCQKAEKFQLIITEKNNSGIQIDLSPLFKKSTQ